ncbi:MAG: hypothetical protein PVH15_07020 [Syntrophobacterales bacterium]|jgi:hypothetical protein
MKKIVSFYYLNYPDRMPDDPHEAFSEVYVEVGDENSDLNHFEETYTFYVYTLGYIKQMITTDSRDFLVGRSVIIVDRFEDKTIERALEWILPNIEEYGQKKG